MSSEMYPSLKFRNLHKEKLDREAFSNTKKQSFPPNTIIYEGILGITWHEPVIMNPLRIIRQRIQELFS